MSQRKKSRKPVYTKGSTLTPIPEDDTSLEINQYPESVEPTLAHHDTNGNSNITKHESSNSSSHPVLSNEVVKPPRESAFIEDLYHRKKPNGNLSDCEEFDKVKLLVHHFIHTIYRLSEHLISDEETIKLAKEKGYDVNGYSDKEFCRRFYYGNDSSNGIIARSEKYIYILFDEATIIVDPERRDYSYIANQCTRRFRGGLVFGDSKTVFQAILYYVNYTKDSDKDKFGFSLIGKIKWSFLTLKRKVAKVFKPKGVHQNLNIFGHYDPLIGFNTDLDTLQAISEHNEVLPHDILQYPNNLGLGDKNRDYRIDDLDSLERVISDTVKRWDKKCFKEVHAFWILKVDYEPIDFPNLNHQPLAPDNEADSQKITASEWAKSLGLEGIVVTVDDSDHDPEDTNVHDSQKITASEWAKSLGLENEVITGNDSDGDDVSSQPRPTWDQKGKSKAL
ncbi:hypothetical protein H4219_003908 [Mycoemilia scoparia]|uniref:Uncharacterized protein n=1 Tax=Mycoemilia scoparia TaxID=417184 RepID=A0A9W7ZTB3_9FUNG|nr:hypothetical protein H4219_003908 [Mycoemilia scoparia]